MSNLRHPNILLFIGACFDEGKYSIITEFMPMGSLQDVLFSKKINFSFKQRILVLKEISLGMNWLHSLSPPLLHRDLKSGNILLDNNFNVKISDFGLSAIKHIDERGNIINGPVGSPFYMAPEILLNSSPEPKSDVYSFSIIMWEVLTNEEPYTCEFESFDELVEGITIDEMRPSIPSWFSPSISSLVTSCWDSDPTRRLSFSDILAGNHFDHIIIDSILSNDVAKTFWKKYFIEKLVVSAEEFISAVSEFTGVPPHLLGFFNALVTQQNATGVQEVTIENFSSKLTDWFTCQKPADIVEKPRQLLSSPWFHGMVALEHVEPFLKTQQPGTWLIRQSQILFDKENAREFYVSYLDNYRNAHHLPFYQLPRANDRFSFNNNTFPSWDSLLNGLTASLQFNRALPCVGSPFLRYFH